MEIKKKKQLSALKPDSQQLAIKDETPGYQLSEEAKNEVEKFKVKQKIVNRENLFPEGKNINTIFNYLKQ